MTSNSVSADELPSAETLIQIAGYTVLDREGKQLPFHSIYAGPNAADRTLIIFVRHFFCGSCQEYLQRLSGAITPGRLSAINTSIAIVGCGDPGLIDYYAKQSRCPFPMYADPSRNLYNALGMISTWALGTQPAYISKSVLRLAIEGIWQVLAKIPSGMALKAGPGDQVGGEFLFESAEDSEKRITWCHRMQRSWGHTEIPELSKVIFGHEVDQQPTGTDK
ncbi:AhpC/TSA antioxidant enzyme-domain-containing protein [Aspergillus aurantiobrunneus]